MGRDPLWFVTHTPEALVSLVIPYTSHQCSSGAGVPHWWVVTQTVPTWQGSRPPIHCDPFSPYSCSFHASFWDE